MNTKIKIVDPALQDSIQRKKEAVEKLQDLTNKLTKELKIAERSERTMLDVACSVGSVVHEIKLLMQSEPLLLQSFQQWYTSTYKKESWHSVRTLNRYENVYIQVALNKQIVYSTMSQVLSDYHRDHPQQKRLKPTEEMKKKSKEELAAAETPELPLVERPKIDGGMMKWTENTITVVNKLQRRLAKVLAIKAVRSRFLTSPHLFELVSIAADLAHEGVPTKQIIDMIAGGPSVDNAK